METEKYQMTFYSPRGYNSEGSHVYGTVAQMEVLVQMDRDSRCSYRTPILTCATKKEAIEKCEQSHARSTEAYKQFDIMNHLDVRPVTDWTEKKLNWTTFLKELKKKNTFVTPTLTHDRDGHVLTYDNGVKRLIRFSESGLKPGVPFAEGTHQYTAFVKYLKKLIGIGVGTTFAIGYGGHPVELED
jgi:hypothetical protein